MKKILFSVTFLMIIINIKAQFKDLNFKDGKIIFQKVYKVENKTKIQLYISANEWFVDNFNDASNVLQLNNENLGILIGKGKSNIIIKKSILTFKLYLNFVVKIELKDSKYRITFSNIVFEEKYDAKYNKNPSKFSAESVTTPENITKKNPKLRKKLKEQLLNTINSLNNSLFDAMNKTDEKW